MEKHYKGKYCVVTGGAGFIGQNLVNKLLEYGAHVVVIDNLSYGAVRSDINTKATLIEGDVRDSDIFSKLPKKKYHYIFHFAAPSSTVLFDENLPDAIDITVRGFLNTLHFAAQNNIRYVYPSTGSLYNGVQPPHTEKAILNPEKQNEYAKTKIALEQLARIYSRSIKPLGLRILAGYGPGEMHKGRFQGVVYGFCLSMIKGEAPVIWGDGSQRRDFVFIEDIVDIILSLSKDCPAPVVNVGTGSDISFKETVDLINTFLKKPVKPTYVPKPKIYLEKTMADTTLLRKYYKRPFTPIETGIKKTIESLQKELRLKSSLRGA